MPRRQLHPKREGKEKGRRRRRKKIACALALWREHTKPGEFSSSSDTSSAGAPSTPSFWADVSGSVAGCFCALEGTSPALVSPPAVLPLLPFFFLFPFFFLLLEAAAGPVAYREASFSISANARSGRAKGR
ncbi:hypothetical protein L209DRAFT_439431 [Thermothelomyces heterothallicus CBS 203.75]